MEDWLATADRLGWFLLLLMAIVGVSYLATLWVSVFMDEALCRPVRVFVACAPFLAAIAWTAWRSWP